MNVNLRGIAISDIINFLALVIGILIAIIGFRLTTASNDINNTLRRESLDTRNIDTYKRYEDLFWSGDPVSEARAVAFFRSDGNRPYQCEYLYGQFLEAQNVLDASDEKRKNRIENHLANIFQVTKFDDIRTSNDSASSKCKEVWESNSRKILQRGPFYQGNKGAVSVCADLQHRQQKCTPLREAIQNRDIAMMVTLLTQGTNPNEEYENGITALIEAVGQRSRQAIDLLLDKGADVNVHGIWTETALTRATRTGDIGIVELLLNRGADVNAIETEAHAVSTFHYGVPTVTPLVIAIEAGNADIVRLLLKKGASPNLKVSRRVGSGFMQKDARELAEKGINSEIRRLLH